MSYPRIIGMAGEFGHGKDEIGKVLVEDFAYVRRAYGDYLKKEVKDVLVRIYAGSLFLEDLESQGCPKACLDAVFDCVAMGQLNPFVKPTSEQMRLLLQLYGTEYRRGQNPNHWVHSLDADRPLPERMVITDVRFQNEVDYVRSLGGFCWRVIRPGFSHYANGNFAKHQSERDLDNINFDAYIYNASDLAGLRKAVHLAMSWPSKGAQVRYPAVILPIDEQNDRVNP